MKVIIDRFEGNFVVVELANKSFVNMPFQLVPKEAKEGTVLSIEIDAEETEGRYKKINILSNQVWHD